MYNIYVKLTTDNTTTISINYEGLYYYKWDHMTLKDNTLYTAAFKFL